MHPGLEEAETLIPKSSLFPALGRGSRRTSCACSYDVGFSSFGAMFYRHRATDDLGEQNAFQIIQDTHVEGFSKDVTSRKQELDSSKENSPKFSELNFDLSIFYIMQRRSRGINVGLLMLLSQVFHIGINNIPPVTLATLALNVWLFLNPLKPLYHSCISVEKCYQQKDWQRLLLSPLHHADDWHLYFNMVSMLWKGIKLERRLGSRWFAYIIATFSLLTGVVYLLLQFALAEFMNQPDFRRNCAVGFSGVLFALKVLNNHYCPGGFVNILGFPVPNRFACWAELLAIHFCTPG
ncbi:hypothetical protein STEG23_025307, partial [Scotinomys teguina]